IDRAVMLAANWARLRATPRAERKLAFVLANYPIRDGRLANGVGYDAPESTVRMLAALHKAGYSLAAPLPPSPLRGGNEGGGLSEATLTAADLIAQLQAGPTNASPERGTSPATLKLARYTELFATLHEDIQSAVTARWGSPATDPFMRGDTFHLPALIFG